jgi:exoribonuclease R
MSCKNEDQITHLTNKCIPGVLILDDNKTYGRESNGRESNGHKKQGRLLYKCIPNDKTIPFMLVPYEIKEMGFSKIFPNLYVTVAFKQWSQKDKHPIANIMQTIGPVDELLNFYEYQLYCKGLNCSIQAFNKEAIKTIKHKNQESLIDDISRKYSGIEDRTGSDWKVFTIDPEGCKDYDDAFSIKAIDENKTLLSIYIANVAIWMDFLNLWNSASKRTSTIYLPDRNRPMLPTILSNSLCSLQEGERRLAFTMDIILDSNKQICSITYVNTCIKVLKNFVYEEDKLISDKNYKHLFETVKCISHIYKYIDTIQDSHEVVSYLMIFMNYFCSQELFKCRNGIFRTNIVNIHSNSESLPEDVYKYIKIWNSNGAEYKTIDDSETNNLSHDTLNLETYIHITSPIRRLVDLLNLIQIQTNKSLVSFSNDAMQFYETWKQDIDFINKSMKSIRKVQHECELLHKCFYNDNTIFENLYDGYCFNKTCTNQKTFQYTVYLPELKLTSYLKTTEELAEYEKKQIKLFLFNNKDKFKQKIRLAIA